MKIGLVCPYNMFQFAGGVQEIVQELAKELVSLGHRSQKYDLTWQKYKT